ncbi:MAG: type II toxin-antitoxin system HicB family antitoxin [bacterium]|nr:type II toxin-antitoxin system HicB family antitoxin [bacterium]
MSRINIVKKHLGRQLPLIVQKGEDGFYVVECPLFDGCYSQGKTLDEALVNIREVIDLILEEKETRETLKHYHLEEVSLHTITV